MTTKIVVTIEGEPDEVATVMRDLIDIREKRTKCQVTFHEPKEILKRPTK